MRRTLIAGAVLALTLAGCSQGTQPVPAVTKVTDTVVQAGQTVTVRLPGKPVGCDTGALWKKYANQLLSSFQLENAAMQAYLDGNYVTADDDSTQANVLLNEAAPMQDAAIAADNECGATT